MTTPEQTPETELEVMELTDENLEEVSGGIENNYALRNPKPVLNYWGDLTAEAQITPPA